MNPARYLILAMLAAIMNYGPTAFAVPPLINYQGFLTDPTGSPLDTTVGMTFKLYGGSGGGATLLWTESQPSISVQAGLFNAQLGSVAALGDAVLNHAELWLGLTVGSNSEMTPRIRMISVGYSYRVGTVDGASGGTITGDVNIIGRGNIGNNNLNPGTGAFVVGTNNRARGNYSVVAGGGGTAAADSNSASGDFATVSGGTGNSATGNDATVAGGLSNSASGTVSTVSGGWGNLSDNTSAAVGGGYYNHASGTNANIGGGAWNIASNWASSVGGGQYNRAGGQWATVAGGGGNFESDSNSALGDCASVGGGKSNLASGLWATVPGGLQNQAVGDESFAAGSGAHANHWGSFVWNSGPAGSSLASSASYEFSAGAAGGVRFYSNQGHTSGVRLAPNASSWSSISDSTKKRNIRLTNTKDVLEKLTAMPIKDWEYKAEDQGTEHIGPMAQDFWKAFHLGSDSLGIATIDADGVVMAAVQELAKRLEAVEKENAHLRTLLDSYTSATGLSSIKPEN